MPSLPLRRHRPQRVLTPTRVRGRAYCSGLLRRTSSHTEAGMISQSSSAPAAGLSAIDSGATRSAAGAVCTRTLGAGGTRKLSAAVETRASILCERATNRTKSSKDHTPNLQTYHVIASVTSRLSSQNTRAVPVKRSLVCTLAVACSRGFDRRSNEAGLLERLRSGLRRMV